VVDFKNIKLKEIRILRYKKYESRQCKNILAKADKDGYQK
jgi:hypothetical protein